ncbi:unnamed protein product [Pieris macdunnoughi]|uniref:Histidine-rich glycoprotein n=1 Tax=Pieris macdunnoughi TaxID=345717 RepID=A0A821UZW7_9NEOP|nr:unnamed protein product [Pieris macdunnoughi]
MCSRVLCIASLMVVLFQYAQCHGPAFSSQHFLKHDGHPEIVHVHGHHGHGHVDYHIVILTLTDCRFHADVKFGTHHIIPHHHH